MGTVAILFGVILLIAIGLLCFRGTVGTGFWLFVAFYLAGCASQLFDKGDRPNSEEKTIVALSRLFEALGCEIIREPKTRDPAVDRLLSGLDLVAHTKERVWGSQ